MTVSSQSSHHPQEVLLAQFSLYVHKGGLKPESYMLMAVGHPWHACKLRSNLYMKNSFLRSSICGSIDHIIRDFPMILVVSYTCLITLELMYNGFLQIHPTHKV